MPHSTERITYSVREAAAALGVSEWMVREEIRCGRIESIRMGTRILIPRQVLERLADIPDHNNEPHATDADA